MQELNSISVLGCGWLGLPLAKSLVEKGYIVKGSTTSNEKLSLLFEAGIAPFLVQFPNHCGLPTLLSFLNSEVLIIAIPPGRNTDKQESYFVLLNTLTKVLPKRSIKKIIFISSSSVYGDLNKTVTELNEPDPDSEAGRRMLKAEQIIAGMPGQHIVLRLSGLIGPGRHPGKFLFGKTGVVNGLAPVNLVHLYDVIGIIQTILEDETATGIFNVTSPDHPTREAFYTLAARYLAIEPPVFIHEKTSWKMVESVRVIPELHYKFQIPDLLKWLNGNPEL